MLLLGHRGARRHAPENTLAAFELAMAHGCQGFEFDVRTTADGYAIICHGPRLGRITVAKSSYRKLLKQCPMLPTLDQVLSQFAATAYLYIELKVPRMDELLLDALAQHPPQRGYVVASFFPGVILSVQARDAGVPLGFICDQPDELYLWRHLPVSMIMLQHRLVTPALIEEIHEAGKQVLTWTVNRAGRMRSLAALGVDGILSDNTELLCRTLASD